MWFFDSDSTITPLTDCYCQRIEYNICTVEVILEIDDLLPCCSMLPLSPLCIGGKGSLTTCASACCKNWTINCTGEGSAKEIIILLK